ncbi:hypothetical protein MRB53_020493 [Persea americana]|uniref:Uncharacterized protein n=1 Tax=Persea americana TaxID=3435 RepID=A0ACC2L206_PERAE|nr:hypothetical protein MRB53_020493 [Persea americana]
MAVIGWIKEEGSLVVLKEDQYLDSGVDESFRLVGMRRAWAGKIRLYDRPPFLPWLLLPLLLNLDFGERRNRRRSVLLNLGFLRGKDSSWEMKKTREMGREIEEIGEGRVFSAASYLGEWR